MLSKRLLNILNFVSGNYDVADIGADHGLVSIEIARKYPNLKVFAVENKKGPFSILSKNIQESHMKNILCSFSDGIDKLSENYKEVIIAGMGGDTIINILENNIIKLPFIENLIIDAHSKIDDVVSFLNECNFYVSDYSYIVEENKEYYILKMKNAHQNKMTNVFSNFDYKLINTNSYLSLEENLKNKKYYILKDSEIEKIYKIRSKKQYEN